MKRKNILACAPQQRGVAAIAFATLLVAVTALLLVSQKDQLRGNEVGRIEAQLDAGQWAREAIDAFAFAHARLPCPAATPNGTEACGGASKGWLPVGTLESFGGLSPDTVRHQPVSYMVYKGGDGAGDPDLTIVSEHFQPLIEGAVAVEGYPEIKTSTDFCQKLQEIDTGVGGRAQVSNTSAGGSNRTDRAALRYKGMATPVNVAYAVSIAQDGKPFLASAANADMGRLTLESPDRPQTQEYSERVVAVHASDLFKRLGCASVMISLDAIASAGSFTAIAVGARQGNMGTADFNVKMGYFFVTSDALAITENLISLLQSSELAMENAALAAAEAAGLPFTIVEFTMHLVGVAMAVAGDLATSVPFVKNTINLANNTWQLAYMQELQSQVNDSTVWSDSSQLLQAAENIDKRGD